VLREPVTEHGREPLRELDVGQVTAVGDQFESPAGKAFDRGVRLGASVGWGRQ